MGAAEAHLVRFANVAIHLWAPSPAALQGQLRWRSACASEQRSFDTMSGLFSGVQLGLRCLDARLGSDVGARLRQVKRRNSCSKPSVSTCASALRRNALRRRADEQSQAALQPRSRAAS